MTEERRKFVRHPSSLPMVYRRMGHVAQLESGIRNISHGGIAFTSDESIEAGALIQVSVPSIDREQSVMAQVLWCIPSDDGFEVGLSFADEENAFKARMVEQACQIEDYRRKLEDAEGHPVDSDRAAREWIDRFAAKFPV